MVSGLPFISMGFGPLGLDRKHSSTVQLPRATLKAGGLGDGISPQSQAFRVALGASPVGLYG